MPSIGILFELESAETLPGEGLAIVGSLPELGRWTTGNQGVQLSTNAFMYPRWTTLYPLWLKYDATGADDHQPEVTFEYKYLIMQSGSGKTAKRWEDRIKNRTVTLPAEPDSLWLVTDTGFNLLAKPISCQVTMPQVRRRWASFVPDWIAPPQTEPRILSADPDSPTTTSQQGSAPPRYFASPDSFALSPRVVPRSEPPFGYPIEKEFNALSPRIVRRLRFPSPRASPRPRRDDGSSRASSQASTCEARADDNGFIAGSAEQEDYRRLYESAAQEADALREENRILREQIMLLAALPDINAPAATAPPARRAPQQPPSGLNFVFQSSEPSELAQVLAKRRSDVDSRAAHFTKESLGARVPSTTASGASSPEEITPLSCHADCLKQGPLVGEQEPHEEPQVGE